MIEQQRLLIEKAKRSLVVAQDTFDHQHFEFVASRTYYTMFYVAEALLLDLGLTFSKHSAVISALGKHFAKPGIMPAEFHKLLLDAHRDRQVADYEMENILGEEDAKVQIQRAKAFLNFAEQYFANKQ